MGSCLMQHGMEAVNLRIRLRLRHPQELSLHFLNGTRFTSRQHAELCVGYHG